MVNLIWWWARWSGVAGSMSSGADVDIEPPWGRVRHWARFRPGQNMIRKIIRYTVMAFRAALAHWGPNPKALAEPVVRRSVDMT